MSKRKTKKVNINNTSNWIVENEYHFGTYAFDKRAYDNMVLAVRETEAKVDFADSKVDWHFACTCLAFLSPSHQQHYVDVEKSTMMKGNETAQAFGFSWWQFNYAFENMTVFKIECFKQTFLLKKTTDEFNYCNFSGFAEWMKDNKNEDGDFVYFADSDKPIVVRSMYNGMSDELKAKCDANNGIVSLADYTDDKEQQMEVV